MVIWSADETRRMATATRDMAASTKKMARVACTADVVVKRRAGSEMREDWDEGAARDQGKMKTVKFDDDLLVNEGLGPAVNVNVIIRKDGETIGDWRIGRLGPGNAEALTPLGGLHQEDIRASYVELEFGDVWGIQRRGCRYDGKRWITDPIKAHAPRSGTDSAAT